MTKLLVAMTLALGGLAAPAFAGGTTAISYHQVGICKGYDTAADPVTTLCYLQNRSRGQYKTQRKVRFRPNASLCGPIHSCTKGQDDCVGQESSLYVFGPEVRAEHGRFECCGNHYRGGHKT